MDEKRVFLDETVAQSFTGQWALVMKQWSQTQN